MVVSKISFADVVQDQLNFDLTKPHHALAFQLIDSSWMQRLRDISQTANTRLVYMFSEHSRFGHSLGVAHLACQLLDQLIEHYPEVSEYACAVAAASILHDSGHLAPGSHTAQKVWFKEKSDEHEHTSIRVVLGDTDVNKILSSHSPELPATVAKILSEDSSLPAWCWEIISGGGWNVDRGNWCMLDSVMAGVSYGKYNIPALTDSIRITPAKHLALRENRLDAMMHFTVSRHAMYKQVYQHRVLLATDMLAGALVERARAIRSQLSFADHVMTSALNAKAEKDLTLSEIYWMRESWWRYHLAQWTRDTDSVIRDLSERLINRRLFKTFRIRETDQLDQLLDQTKSCADDLGFDPQYYVHLISTKNTNLGDSKRSMLVIREDGSEVPLTQAEPLFDKMLEVSKHNKDSWIAVPAEVKRKLNRVR